YSRIYGIEPYNCVPFSKPYRIFGSFCAQASIFVALVICTRIGGHAIGTFEITSIANPGKDFFPVEGLTVQQISDVFKDKSVKLNSFLEIFRDVNEPNLNLKLSCINGIILGYLEAGLPVILNVDYNMLYGTKVPKPAHCVVLIGYKRGIGLDPACYIYNDSSRGPFMEKDLFSILNAAIGADMSVKFIVPVPLGVAHSLTEIPQVHERIPYEIGEGTVFKYSLVSDKVLRQYSVSLPAKETSAEENQKIDQTIDKFICPQLDLYRSKIPKYVWVKEFYDSFEDATMGYCSAFAIFDATSEHRVETEDPFILFFDGQHLTLRDIRLPMWLFGKRKMKVKRIPLVA
ncbi:C39 family peptidase, partial [Candidatus Bathyarchaeota archaeon]|nr:C39 family peptidase [Candidatus Bathyarchaeota archaeon]